MPAVLFLVFAAHKKTIEQPIAPNRRAGSRTANSRGPKTFTESADSQYSSGGLRKNGRFKKCGVSQSPSAVMDRAQFTYMDSSWARIRDTGSE